MKVIEYDPWWVLFEHEGMFLLESSCDISATTIFYTIELSPDEVSKYQKYGRSYLSDLSSDSASVVKDSGSIYKNRDVTDNYSDAQRKALEDWKKQIDT